jgi:outer membrane biosynthesis protein TonB
VAGFSPESRFSRRCFSGVQFFGMKASAILFALTLLVPPTSSPQTSANPSSNQLHQIQISADVAQKLLIHKAELQCPKLAMPPRFTATVVVAFELDREGTVRYPSVVSGPPLLRTPVLNAVRNYKYKPYLLNGKAVDVETTVPVSVDTYRDCPNHEW